MTVIRLAISLTLFSHSVYALEAGGLDATALVQQWQQLGITGHCPVSDPSPNEMEKFKQAVVAAGFLTVSFGGGEATTRPCVMITCPDAVSVPYVLHDEAAFNRLYEPAARGGRACFASKGMKPD